MVRVILFLFLLLFIGGCSIGGEMKINDPIPFNFTGEIMNINSTDVIINTGDIYNNYDQSLNTTDNVSFQKITNTEGIRFNGYGSAKGVESVGHLFINAGYNLGGNEYLYLGSNNNYGLRVSPSGDVLLQDTYLDVNKDICLNDGTCLSDLGGHNASICPLGYSCPSDYAELVLMGVNLSIKNIWVYSNLVENGNDLFLNHNLTIEGNNNKIIYDTSGCSGGNIHTNNNANITIKGLSFEGAGCSTPMFYNDTSGNGALNLIDVNINNVPVKALTYYGKHLSVINNKWLNVGAGLTLDNTLYSVSFDISGNTFTWDNESSVNESEGIDINHVSGRGVIKNNIFGTSDGLHSFQENIIDCNTPNCSVRYNVLYGDPSNAQTNTMLLVDTTISDVGEYEVVGNKLYNVCQNMTGIKLGGSSSTANDKGKIRGNFIYGCGGYSTSNKGIATASNMKTVSISDNYVEGTYYGVYTVSTNTTLFMNEFKNIGFSRNWYDVAPSSWRITNVRMDRQTIQTGVSGYLCINNPVREWEVSRGASC